MPNFWTKTCQKMDEVFNGPRTKDTMLESKIEEMYHVEKGLTFLRTTFQNLLTNSVGIKNFFRNVNTSMELNYTQESPYYDIMNEIKDLNIHLEEYFDRFFSNISNFYSRTSEWHKFFVYPKQLIEKREVNRKTYDHYDEKIEKIYKNRADNFLKEVQMSKKELEIVKRNETKYKEAIEEYVKISEETYNAIETMLEKKTEQVNSIITELVLEERNFFFDCSNALNKYALIGNTMKNLNENLSPKENVYDARKFIRGGLIIQKIDDNNNQNQNHNNVFDEEDFQYENNFANFINNNHSPNKSNNNQVENFNTSQIFLINDSQLTKSEHNNNFNVNNSYEKNDKMQNNNLNDYLPNFKNNNQNNVNYGYPTLSFLENNKINTNKNNEIK